MAAERFSRLSLEDLHHVITLTDRALELQPDNPMALAMRVDALMSLESVYPGHRTENSDESLTRMADRAIEINPHSDYAYSVRSHVRLWRLGNYTGALEDAYQSIKLSPNYSWGFSAIGQALICLERASEAIKPLQRAQILADKDPWRPYHSGDLALALFLSGESNRALKIIDSLISQHPLVWTYHNLRAAIFEQQHNPAGAEQSRQKAEKCKNTPHILAGELPLPAPYREMLNPHG